jgi:PAS domain S-box-containing protein
MQGDDALDDGERLFLRLIDHSNQGIMLHRQQKALYVNQAFVELFGYSNRQEILDLDSTQGFVDPEYWYPEIQDEIKEGTFEAHNLEYKAVRKDGSRIWVQAYSFLIDWQGKPTLCTARTDISARKDAELTIAAQRDELATLNREKDRFFSIIAHDLQSPFTALLGFSQMMTENAEALSKDKLVEYAANVNEAGNQIFELLQNLLSWSRLQMDGGNYEFEMVGLADAVDKCMALLAPVAADKGISLTTTVAEDHIHGHADMLQTVIRNIVANAIKFTPSGGAISLSSQRRDDLVRVSIADSGVGMTETQIAQVFSIDQKTSTAGTDGEQGTGLGLPLCKDMVERMGGTIGIESTPGGGTRFHFTLPYRRRNLSD